MDTSKARIGRLGRFSLEGKTALVTGGSRGLGAEIATTLAEAGADVAIVAYRNHSGLAATADKIRAAGRTCHEIVADLSTSDGARYAAGEALRLFGPGRTLNILINNAGVYHPAPLLEATAEEWDDTMALNLRAPMLLAQAVAPGMIEGGGGKIVNKSSTAGLVATEGEGAYASSKGGLNMLTKVMAAEWGRHNIQCNSVCPTVVLTDMGKKAWSDPAKSGPLLAKLPMGRFGEPVEVADLVLFLSSRGSDWMTGQCIALDGGQTCV